MDLAIFSTRIFTGNPAQPWAEALKVTDNRISAVGSNAEVKQACHQDTTRLELPGRLVTPGLVDAHCHFVRLGQSYDMVDLRHTSSLAQARECIRQAAASRRPGEWIIGRGWNHHHWEEHREPTRHDLDDLTPDNPAMMVRVCGHSLWVNTPALARAGITRETAHPPGGHIDKEPHRGEPTGLIREARFLIEHQIPPPTFEARKRAALAAQREALRCGITGVHSCETLTEWEALAALEQEGNLKLRVYHLLPPDDLEDAAAQGIAAGTGSDRLWFGHVKLFADGSLGAGTALLHDPYCDDPTAYGLAFLEPDVLQDKIELAYHQGYDVAIHAIGDRAVSNALESIAAARTPYPGRRRDRLEHVQLFRPRDLSRFHDLGVVASVQPGFLPTDWATAETRWGRDRCRHAYAWKSLLHAGLRVQFGSDAPVEPINPVFGLHAAVTRQTPAGEPPGGWGPDQSLSLAQSLTGYTAVAAWVARREATLGAIAPGKWADLTVFEQDLFRLPPARWTAVATEMTMVHGDVVYHKTS